MFDLLNLGNNIHEIIAGTRLPSEASGWVATLYSASTVFLRLCFTTFVRKPRDQNHQLGASSLMEVKPTRLVPFGSPL